MNTKAKESVQIQKAREKIKRQLEAADKRFNPDTLARMSLLIQKQLARHQPERVSLKKRQVKAFDENQHPAKTKNSFVKHLLSQLEHEEYPSEEAPLEGRIKSISDIEPTTDTEFNPDTES